MDQGVIATLKKKYAKHTLNAARIIAQSAQSVTDIVKDIKIFDAIINAKVAWEAIEPETIIKCFKHSGIQEKYDSNTPPTTPVVDDDDAEFNIDFQNLLNMPWDEYLTMDQELELEEPSCVPDTLLYAIDNDNHHDHDETPEDETPVKPDEALKYLMDIQKSNLGDTKLFDILEQAMTIIQNKKTVSELTSKSKQSSIAKYFQF